MSRVQTANALILFLTAFAAGPTMTHDSIPILTGRQGLASSPSRVLP